MPQRINGRYVAARVALGHRAPRKTPASRTSPRCGGGQCVTFHAGALHRQLYWDPTASSPASPSRTRNTPQHTFAGDHPDLCARLGRAAQDAPAAPVGRLGFLHRVGPALPMRRLARASCVLTYHREGGPSDERPWARLAAQRAGCEHFEHARTPRFEFSSPVAHAPAGESTAHVRVFGDGPGGSGTSRNTQGATAILQWGRRLTACLVPPRLRLR